MVPVEGVLKRLLIRNRAVDGMRFRYGGVVVCQCGQRHCRLRLSPLAVKWVVALNHNEKARPRGHWLTMVMLGEVVGSIAGGAHRLYRRAHPCAHV